MDINYRLSIYLAYVMDIVTYRSAYVIILCLILHSYCVYLFSCFVATLCANEDVYEMSRLLFDQ